MTLWDAADFLSSFERVPPRHVSLARLAALSGWSSQQEEKPQPATPDSVREFASAMSGLNRR